jgi:hypothetical protein
MKIKLLAVLPLSLMVSEIVSIPVNRTIHI